MELRLRRDLFLAELSPMQGIVERRTTIPVLSHILLKTSAKSLQLAATDLDVSLTSSVPAEVEREGALAVQAKKFTEIVRSVVAEEIRLKVEDERTLLVQAGKARNLGIHACLLDHHRVARGNGFHFSVGKRRAINVLDAPQVALAIHHLGDEARFGLQRLPHIRVKRPLGDVTVDLNFGVCVALAENSAFTLFDIGGPPRGV